jgi:hypothetical protein
MGRVTPVRGRCGGAGGYLRRSFFVATLGSRGSFGFLYNKSGADFDLDGDVDGGFLDSLGGLFE